MGDFRSECWGNSSAATTAVGQPTGAFKGEASRTALYGAFSSQATDYYGYSKIDFNASVAVPTSTEVKPYSMRVLFLIAY